MTTALVSEVYLKLFSKGTFVAPNRRYFYGAVARAMRQVLTDHARKPRPPRVDLDNVLNWPESERDANVLDLDCALQELEKMHPRHYRVVMQKIFAGRRTDDIARDEEKSSSTIEKDWAFARGWLRRRLEDETDGR